jgi:hypothetical protein
VEPEPAQVDVSRREAVKFAPAVPDGLLDAMLTARDDDPAAVAVALEEPVRLSAGL